MTEILRSDDDLFVNFGQVYITTAYPGVVKGWHYHKNQVDNFVVVKGMTKLVLYDPREDSPFRGERNEFFLGEHNPTLVQIPKLIYHGFKCTSQEEAICINCPTEVPNCEKSDEYRIDPYTEEIPYDWERKDG